MGHKNKSDSDSSSGSDRDDEYKKQKKHMSKEQKAAYKLEKKRQKELGLGGGDKHARSQHAVEHNQQQQQQQQPPSHAPFPEPGRPAFPSHGEAAGYFAGAATGHTELPPPLGTAGMAFPDPSHHGGTGQRAFNNAPPMPGGGPPPAQPTHAAGFPQQTPPPSGYRIPLSAGQPFPAQAQAGPAPFRDLDGSAVYVGSALFDNPSSVHPCKIAAGLNPPARVPYGGTEHEHDGRYDLLPFVPEQMEWVRTRAGIIPPGRRPIEGGYESGGGRLFHGYAEIHGIGVPGKVGEHLGGINLAFGGQEISLQEGYFILCWR